MEVDTSRAEIKRELCMMGMMVGELRAGLREGGGYGSIDGRSIVGKVVGGGGGGVVDGIGCMYLRWEEVFGVLLGRWGEARGGRELLVFFSLRGGEGWR